MSEDAAGRILTNVTILFRRGITWCAFSVAIMSNASAQPTLKFAIVPFTNISSVPEHQWLGVGIAETLSIQLENIIEIDVIPNIMNLDSPNRRDNSESTPLTWPKTLDLVRNRGANILIAGDQQQSNGHLRFTARLIDLATETEIDTIDVEGTIENIFLLQDKLSEAILKAIEKVIHTKALSSLANDEGENSSKSDSPPALSIKRPSPRSIGDIEGLPAAAMKNPHTLPSTVSLSSTEPASTVTNRPIIRARRASETPTIDGILEDSIWTNAALINGFTQTNPVEGARPTETTEVRIAYDDENLYFGFHAQHTDPGQMRANHVDRDQIRRDDWIAVIFDTFQDQQRAYRFSVNPFGVQGDAIIEGGRRMRGPPGGGGDTSWDALFESSGIIVHDGWTARSCYSIQKPPLP